MEKGTNPLSEGEMHCIWMCCRILKVKEKEKIDSIGAKAMKDDRGKVQATMSSSGETWMHWARRWRATGENHLARPTPLVMWTTWTLHSQPTDLEDSPNI